MKDDGGPAFANAGVDGSWQDGMSLRAYIATAALQGIIAHPGMEPDDCNQVGCASLAVGFADALLKELAK